MFESRVIIPFLDISDILSELQPQLVERRSVGRGPGPAFHHEVVDTVFHVGLLPHAVVEF